MLRKRDDKSKRCQEKAMRRARAEKRKLFSTTERKQNKEMSHDRDVKRLFF